MTVLPSARPLPNSYWVIPGKFLAGEHPQRGAKRAAKLRERLQQLLNSGINSFIDLTQSLEFASYAPQLPAGVEYFRCPILDHSVPQQAEQMQQLQNVIRKQLEQGKCLYLHCRAGIGRTGTAVGCYLVESGAAPDQALVHLNQLWQSCDHAQHWPHIPETQEQVDYVRGWRVREVAPTQAVPTQAAPIQRFHGALFGLAIGDALAVPTHGFKNGAFKPVTTLTGGGLHHLPAGAWTDDTALALCSAESLLACQGFEVKDLLNRFRAWREQGHLSATGQCIGIATHTAKILAETGWRGQQFSGSHDPSKIYPEVLSRVAPFALFAYSMNLDASYLASEAARLTCQAPAALDACRLLAASLQHALAGLPKAQILAPAVVTSSTEELLQEVLHIQQVAERRGRPPARNNAVYVLAAAYWAFAQTSDFAAGALKAANLGGHSDVITAVYGQLAGAYYGLAAIPAPWRATVLQSAYLQDFADRLATGSGKLQTQ
jgi:ADP-ribosylglycohydrolase